MKQKTGFEYLIGKINKAEIIEKPFPHLEIQNFLSEEHLNTIINDKQIHFDEMDDDDSLYEELIRNNWKIQNFPGCINNWVMYKEYLKKGGYKSTDPVENVGITFRLQSYNNRTIESLLHFMNSDSFQKTLKKKFEVMEETTIISAIQKNLTGYEISPHPDIRQKCLTYLLNINNNSDIEKQDCHTHLLEFKNEYKYIEDYWENNPAINRCWVPWDWCETVKTMSKNNTMLIFKPESSPPTLHAIRLKYNHLKYQRTQIYGNLMYKYPEKYISLNYSDLYRS